MPDCLQNPEVKGREGKMKQWASRANNRPREGTSEGSKDEKDKKESRQEARTTKTKKTRKTRRKEEAMGLEKELQEQDENMRTQEQE